MAIQKISAAVLANNAVTAASIAGGAISAADIGDNSIGIDQLNVSDGTNGQALTTNGSGTLSFATIQGYTDSDVETYLNTSTIYTDSTNNLVGIGASSPSSFNTNRNNLVISDNSGAVGLTINSVDTTGSSILSFTDGASGTLAGEIHYVHSTDYMMFKTSNTERMRIDSSGNIQFWNSGSVVGSITTTSSGTTYNTTSDKKLKENIEPIVDGKQKLMSMKPSTFNFIADEEKKKIHGFIAQEMQEIIPESITSNDELLSMDYGRITPILVAALQDAFKEIEELKNKLESK